MMVPWYRNAYDLCQVGFTHMLFFILCMLPARRKEVSRLQPMAFFISIVLDVINLLVMTHCTIPYLIYGTMHGLMMMAE